MKRTVSLLVLSCVAAASFSSGLGVAGDFNAFVIHNATLSGGESEGAMAIGGNLTTSNPYQIAFNSTAPGLPVNANTVGLYVGGDVNFAGGQLAAGKVMGGNAFIGGAFSSSNIQVNAGSVNPAGSFVDQSVFNGVQASLQALSQSLAGLPGLSLAGAPQNMTVNLAVNTGSSDPNLKVFHLGAGDIDNLGTVNFQNFTGNETIIFNVSGPVVNWSMSVNNQGSNPNSLYNRIIWNFSDATTVNILDRSIGGSVLAMGAHVNQGQVIDGSLFADSWSSVNSPEIHSYLFKGNLDSVPEPFSLTALGLGALLMRRKKRSA